MSEELTAEEREYLDAYSSGTDAKLLRLYDAALARAEAAERGEKDAVKACDDNWVTHQRVVAAEKAHAEAHADAQRYYRAKASAESSLAEATALLERCESGAVFPLPSQDRQLYADLRAFLSATPAQAAEPTLVERIRSARGDQ